MRLLLPAVLAAFCLAVPARAFPAPLIEADASTFPSAKERIEKDLKGGKTYAELTRSQKEEVLAALERIEDTLTRAPTVAALPMDEKLRLVNDQELVNTILTQAAEDSRMICRQERKTGSHRPMPKCRTVGEIRREREASVETARRLNRSTMRSPGN